MGWRHTLTKYCQIIRPVNRLKRFIYASLSKRFGEDYDDAIFVDECTVELRIFNPTNWRALSFAWHDLYLFARRE